ncbi:MAG: 50S ribosomal protein L17 [Gemmataceae bacterium]|nr:50S ribosomal protein L17 [Gemmataceae bacterium]
MRHRKAGYKLGRNAPHRTSLYRNLAMALIRHERIITTVEKAKAVKPFIEKLITLAKKGTLHARRLVIQRLGPTASAVVKPDGADKKPDKDLRTIVQKLFDDLGPRFRDRPGGYTRLIKRHERRLGDAGRTAFLELLKAGETKVSAKAPAPPPRVEEPAGSETPPEQPKSEPAPPQTPSTGTREAASGGSGGVRQEKESRNESAGP